MAEYIERTFATESIGRVIENLREMATTQLENRAVDLVQYTKDYISRLPAADVVPAVHAEWVQVICHVEFEDGFVDRVYECCSACHMPNGRKQTDFCPHCGAKMDQ